MWAFTFSFLSSTVCDLLNTPLMQHPFSKSKTLLPCVSCHLLGCCRLKGARPAPGGVPLAPSSCCSSTWCDGPLHPLPPAERFIKQGCVGVKERRVLSMPLLKKRRRCPSSKASPTRSPFYSFPEGRHTEVYPILAVACHWGGEIAGETPSSLRMGTYLPSKLLKSEMRHLLQPPQQRLQTSECTFWFTMHYSNPCFCYGAESDWTPLLQRSLWKRSFPPATRPRCSAKRITPTGKEIIATWVKTHVFHNLVSPPCRHWREQNFPGYNIYLKEPGTFVCFPVFQNKEENWYFREFAFFQTTLLALLNGIIHGAAFPLDRQPRRIH